MVFFALSQTMASVGDTGRATGKARAGRPSCGELVAQKESLAKNVNFGVGVDAIASSTRMNHGKERQVPHGSHPTSTRSSGATTRATSTWMHFTASLESDVNSVIH